MDTARSQVFSSPSGSPPSPTTPTSPSDYSSSPPTTPDVYSRPTTPTTLTSRRNSIIYIDDWPHLFEYITSNIHQDESLKEHVYRCLRYYDKTAKYPCHKTIEPGTQGLVWEYINNKGINSRCCPHFRALFEAAMKDDKKKYGDIDASFTIQRVSRDYLSADWRDLHGVEPLPEILPEVPPESLPDQDDQEKGEEETVAGSEVEIDDENRTEIDTVVGMTELLEDVVINDDETG